MFIVRRLFGSEDVDLRIVPPNIAVSDVLTPPPPPIISTKEEKNVVVIANKVCMIY